MDIEKFIDSRGKQLLAELRKDLQIEFIEGELEFCHMNINGNKVKIFYNPLLVDNESVIHELLHADLIKYRYEIGNNIFLLAQDEPVIKEVFTKFLCDYIENCLDHYKMFPKYIEMGYNPEKFLWKGVKEKCTIDQINDLTLNFGEVYFANSINKYIGYLISIYADHIDNDYSEHLTLLKQKDDVLFDITTRFWESWMVFDIKNIDPINNSYLMMTFLFAGEIINWIKPKLVI